MTSPTVETQDREQEALDYAFQTMGARSETNPQEADRLLGRCASLPLEIERAIQLLTEARYVAQDEPDKARRAIALTAVAGGWMELARVTGANR